MKPTINLNREGDLIQIFIPAHLGRHAGRKTILSPSRLIQTVTRRQMSPYSMR